MKDISPRVLVLSLCVVLVVAASVANWHGGITTGLAAILGALAGCIPKMLERSSIFDTSKPSDPTPPTSSTSTAPAAPAPSNTPAVADAAPVVGAVSAIAIALAMGCTL